MKKLYLSLAAALLSATAMSAKELTFYVGNTAVQPGATVEYELQDGDVDDFGDYAEYNIQPGVYLHADLIGQVEINVVSNLDVEVCVGQCYTGTDITRTTTIQSGQKLDLKYHIMGETEGGAVVAHLHQHLHRLLHRRQGQHHQDLHHRRKPQLRHSHHRCR